MEKKIDFRFEFFAGFSRRLLEGEEEEENDLRRENGIRGISA